MSIFSENTGAGMSKTYSARGCGWLRLRGSMATKTTKSGSVLKAGIGREQLVFASDNLSANPNACSRISSFCKPFRSHLRHPHPRAERFSKRRSAVSRSTQVGKVPANVDFERVGTRLHVVDYGRSLWMLRWDESSALSMKRPSRSSLKS